MGSLLALTGARPTLAATAALAALAATFTALCPLHRSALCHEDLLKTVTPQVEEYHCFVVVSNSWRCIMLRITVPVGASFIVGKATVTLLKRHGNHISVTVEAPKEIPIRRIRQDGTPVERKPAK
jgi:hypothetical protein